MSLFLHELVHFFLSFVAAFASWQIFFRHAKNKKELMVLSLFGGFLGEFLMDIDHLVDYVLAFGLNFRLDYFLSGAMFDKLGKTFVPLHGWEWVLVLSTIAFLIKQKNWRYFLTAVAIGMFLHLAYDTIYNHFYLLGYSFLYRALHNFEIFYIAKPD